MFIRELADNTVNPSNQQGERGDEAGLFHVDMRRLNVIGRQPS